MAMRGENWRFWLPVSLLAVLYLYSGQKLVRSHVDPDVTAPNYYFDAEVPARRGSIYSAYGAEYPLVKSVPCWEYHFDPVALTNAVAAGTVRRKGEPVRPRDAVLKTISDALKAENSSLTFAKLKKMAENTSNRYQYLALSSDPDMHRTLADSSLVAGVAIRERQVRQYLNGRSLSHVLGSLNAEMVGSAGIELKYNKLLSGTPGTVRGMRDAFRRELYDKRIISIAPKPGSDIHLTIEPNVQFWTENALKAGLREYGAGSGWAIVMDAETGAIYAMASYPDFDPVNYGRTTDSQKMNRAIAFNYEPGSVMKVITAAAAIDSNPRRYGPGTRFNTNRADPAYYKLPGDAGHVWEATMSLKDAIVHSSNIVMGKVAYDLGPYTMFKYMKKFGFGEKTGIELPGEQFGILRNPHKQMWDKASWSRAGIGQFVAVTAIQLVSAYQAIANNGVRMKPYLVSRIVGPDGEETYRRNPEAIGRVVSAETARTVRKMMLDVASPAGTARRAAIRGYSIAGKTGTAQKPIPGGKGYMPGLYRASFCGIVPASDPRLVILTTLDFDERAKFHQGGNSAGPVFKRIALSAIRYLGVQPDKPDELEGQEEDEFDKMLEERAHGT